MGGLALLGGEKAIRQDFVKWPVFDETDVKAVEETVRSGKWNKHEGSRNSEFVKMFSGYVGTKFGLAVTNGTAALEIPLAVLGAGPGDEVIVPSYTFVSTATAVAFNAATPVFCDVDPDTYNIDADMFESLLTPRTKAVIPVHFAGYPADMDRILEISGKHGIHIVEDCAHAHGTVYKKRKAGSFGTASAFSFQSSKNLTSGEGGIILTDDEDLYRRMYSRHSCGRLPDRPWYEHYAISSNIRLSEIQAALLTAQFARLETQAGERLANARRLDEGFSRFRCLTCVQPPKAEITRRAYHLYLIRYSPGIEGVSRGTFIKALQAEGLPVSGGYPVPLYRQPLFGKIAKPVGQKCEYSGLYHPGAERICSETIWFPQYMLLGDESHAGRILDAVEKVLRNAGPLRKWQKDFASGNAGV